jgi:site-specific DNA recombinase
VIVAGWIAEVKGAQLAAERELAQTRSDGQLMAEEVRQLVQSLKDIPKVLADSDPKLKAKVYGELGVRIAYEPGERLVVAEARLACTTGGVGGGT